MRKHGSDHPRAAPKMDLLASARTAFDVETAAAGANGTLPQFCLSSEPAHVDHVGARGDIRECQWIGAGHPHLRSKLAEGRKQCGAPVRIEMCHHLVEQ